MSHDSLALSVRTDFYTVIHKALRKRFFEAIVLAGTTDYDHADDRGRLVQTVGQVVTMLREHASHEDEFIHPILAEALPETAKMLRAEHEEHNRALDQVERSFAVAAAEGSGASAHLAYRTLARFGAHFLAHLEEEEAGQPRLWETAGEARFATAMTAFKRSRTLDQTLAVRAA